MEIMTVKEVAEMLGISRQRVSQLKTKKKLLPTIKVGELWFYDREVVKNYKRGKAGRPVGSKLEE